MTVRFERPVSRAAFLSRRLAVFAFLMFVAAWGMHRFGPFGTPSFLAVGLAAGIIAALAVYLALLGIAALWFKGARGGKAATTALFFSILPLTCFGIAGLNYINLPHIYDVSSDLANPPQWIEAPPEDTSWLGPRKPVSAADRQAQLAKWRDLTGRRYEGALDRVYTAARKVALDQGLVIEVERGAPELALQELPADQLEKPDDVVPDAVDVPVPQPRPANLGPDENAPLPGEPSIQGEKRTLVFGFRQDVVIRLREETETTLVDVRVASRYGDHDLGSGVAFIEKYLRALDAELLGIAGD
jgi:hypothetical protein